MDFLVPKLSATMETAKVAGWLKKVGDTVKMGEAVVEIETDKATLEVEAPADATLEAILAEAGTELPIGGVMGRFRVAGETSLAEPSPRPAAASAPAGAPAATAGSAGRAAPNAGPATGSSNQSGRVLASPLARRLAQINEVDLSTLTGTGPHGRVRKRDVLAAASGRPAAALAGAAIPPAPTRSVATPVIAASAGTPPPAGTELLSSMRAGIAQSVTLSRQTIPSFVLDRWIGTGALERARALLAPEFEQATGIRLTVTDFLVQAMADALGAHPHMLDRWQDGSDPPARIRAGTVDIGLVVAVADGVMVPVLRDLAGKTLGGIAQARQAAVQRARAGRLSGSDYAPVSISLSNIGRSGADRFEAIISPGQSAIMAVGRVHERVVARAGAIAIAQGVNVALSVDHRLIDGLHGGAFLATLADRIELGPWSAA